MTIILWTIAAVVSSIANGKFLLWQNDPYFAYRFKDAEKDIMYTNIPFMALG